jgi:hypothetical protein
MTPTRQAIERVWEEAGVTTAGRCPHGNAPVLRRTPLLGDPYLVLDCCHVWQGVYPERLEVEHA